MIKYLSVLVFLICISNPVYAQSNVDKKIKFGGPYTAFSFNKYGASFSMGGGGVFVEKNNFYIGVFGQGTTKAFKRETYLNDEKYLLKSKQTGFWIGYVHGFQTNSKLKLSVYNKFGFGKVALDNPVKSLNYYDTTMVFTPNLEISYEVTKFLDIGVAVFYEIFTSVDFYGYTPADFNSSGVSILFKFKGTD